MPSDCLFLVFGDDEYLVTDKARSLIRERVPPGADATLQCERIDGAVDKVEGALAALRGTFSALDSMGLFSEGKTVWLEGATFFGDNRTSQSAVVQEEINRLAGKLRKGLAPGVTLVISAAAVDKRRAFYKACNAAGSVFEFAVPEDKPGKDHAMVNARLDEFLHGKGLTMVPAARDAFQQKVGLETRLIRNELEKLAVALGKRTRVEVDDVARFVSASREAAFWDLADAFARRDLAGALRILRQLVFQRQNMVGLITNLERRIRELLVYREGIDRKWLVPKTVYGNPGYAWSVLPPEVEQTFASSMEKDPRGMHPFRVSILGTQAAGFTRKRLEHSLRQVTLAHESMVSSRVPPELIMEVLLVRALGSPRRAVRGAAAGQNSSGAASSLAKA